ncbi:hypothetical protein EX30DRAFT_130619 [Ascodesmis nigricans]|uniref:Uncharacterized protein n=1 Tax=Ascodesmis nigricans TaxID=341454 RepID=A0A4S2MSG7_9PEZI|nr:hypothetical protein EX30DRAFT_130619 [Ascodesmis nigricans]
MGSLPPDQVSTIINNLLTFGTLQVAVTPDWSPQSGPKLDDDADDDAGTPLLVRLIGSSRVNCHTHNRGVVGGGWLPHHILPLSFPEYGKGWMSYPSMGRVLLGKSAIGRVPAYSTYMYSVLPTSSQFACHRSRLLSAAKSTNCPTTEDSVSTKLIDS